jgi:hypothetical protein
MLPDPGTKVKFLVLSASPSSVLLKVIAPPAVVSTDPDAPFLMTGTGNMIELFAVVIFAPRKIVPVEEKFTAFDTILPGSKIFPPVSDNEANSPRLEVPTEERLNGPVPALIVTVRKFPVMASRGDKEIAPPFELMVRSVPAPSSIAGVVKVIGVAELVKVVSVPELKFTAGAV